MRSTSRILVVALTLFGCIGCDQASKSVARAYLGDGATASYLQGAVRLQLAENAGAFLSLGASWAPQVRFALLCLAAGALLVGLLSTALLAERLGRWRSVALALVAGGGTSNLIDRLADHGFVTDFMNVGFGGLRTGIFNVADLAIVAGVLALLVGRGGSDADAA